jgi:hypothetical protein
MKNFSEATVIRSELDLHVSMILAPVADCGCTVMVNGLTLHQGSLIYPITLDTHVALTDEIVIEIAVQNRQHPQAIIISDIRIDGYEIMPKYQNLASPPTNYLDKNGTWTFKISSFYPWYHELTGQGWIA